MRIRISELKSIIRSVLVEETGVISTGKDLKGNVSSDKAIEKIKDNPAIKSALDKITDAKSLAAFLQDILQLVSEKGIDQNEITSAINALKTALSSKSSSTSSLSGTK